MQTYLTQMLVHKLGGYLVTNIFELRRDKHSTSTTKKYVMDTGLLIALITLLGGGFIIILKKKKRWLNEYSSQLAVHSVYSLCKWMNENLL